MTDINQRIAVLARKGKGYCVSISIRTYQSNIQLIPFYTTEPTWAATIESNSIEELLDVIDDVVLQCLKGGSMCQTPQGVDMWIGREGWMEENEDDDH